MKVTRRRSGAVRLQTLQAEMGAAGGQKPAKSLASYFSVPGASKTARPKPAASGASS